MNHTQISPWKIQIDGDVSDFVESIFALGNGVIGVRGFSVQTSKQNPWDHAIFYAGLFETIKPGITDMVQLPDVLGFRIKGEQMQDVNQTLDMKNAILTQTWRSDNVSVKTQRIVNMADTQQICIRLTITALKDCEVEIESIKDANVCNLPIHDDQMIQETQSVRLLETVSETQHELIMQTAHTKIPIRFLIETIGNTCVSLKSGETLTAEKRIRILVDNEARHVDAIDPWQAHMEAWEHLWQDCDIQMETTDEIQGAMRYNIFQMLSNNADKDEHVSIGARGLTHGRYKGNAFWDTDIFLLPFYCYHRPLAARNLIQFRLHGLQEAKNLAKKQNLEGARYPWMCASDGLEQCESWDIGLCETHITADVAYAADRYQAITGDQTLSLGELFSETAQYWHSRFTWEEKKQQYTSFFVKGPDEYCGATINNTFTNYMARHNVRLALKKSSISEEAFQKLSHFEKHIALLYDPSHALYLQDELFERLEPMNAKQNQGEALYKTICFDRMQRYRALKQADVVQLMILFPHEFSSDQKQAAWACYEPLTVHDSSLSFGSHAVLAFQLGLLDKGWDYFKQSVLFDLSDLLGNTGQEGIHMASLGISWQAVVFGMMGLWSHNGTLTLSPHLPNEIRSISLRLYHQGKKLRITVCGQETTIESEE